VCVAAHFALGPHWLSDEQVAQAPLSQTSPGEHCAFELHVWQPPVHCVQTRSSSQ
jgi:hypothetical protein